MAEMEKAGRVMSRKRFELDSFPVGRTYLATVPEEVDRPGWSLRLHFLPESQMITIDRWGETETVHITVAHLRPGLYKLSWQEGTTTVVHTHDYTFGHLWVDFTTHGILNSRTGTIKEISQEDIDQVAAARLRRIIDTAWKARQL